MAGPNEERIRELYEDDPFVDPYWYGKMIEEAQAADATEAHWSERAAAEAEQLAETEEVDE